jgi:hypothetical protein
MSDIAEPAGPLRQQGATLAAIAATLNAEGFVTRRGKECNPVQVKREVERAHKPREESPWPPEIR